MAGRVEQLYRTDLAQIVKKRDQQRVTVKEKPPSPKTLGSNENDNTFSFLHNSIINRINNI